MCHLWSLISKYCLNVYNQRCHPEEQPKKSMKGSTLIAAVTTFSRIYPTVFPAFPFLVFIGTSRVPVFKILKTVMETCVQQGNIMLGWLWDTALRACHKRFKICKARFLCNAIKSYFEATKSYQNIPHNIFNSHNFVSSLLFASHHWSDQQKVNLLI